MCNKYVFETVDKCFKDIMKNENTLFGGKVVVLGGDFRQILPVVVHGSRNDIVSCSLKNSYIWNQVYIRHLTINMRALSGSPNEPKERQQEFVDYLLRIGDGIEKTVKIPMGGNTFEELVEVKSRMVSKSTNLNDFIDEVYPNISNIEIDSDYATERTILTAKNEDVDVINEKILKKINGNEFVYYSADEVAVSYDQSNSNLNNILPVEYLNSITLPGIPPHKLTLKKGSIIMLMRNLNPSLGLCNGTRLICKSFASHLIEADIVTGVHRCEKVLIPRICFIPSDTELPFDFKRRQFPIRPAFAMTINKAQGQTMKFVGIYLPHPVFSHGQLYVALSRVSSENNVCIMVEGDKYNVSNKTFTKNVVYTEIFGSATTNNVKAHNVL
jgi:PIF1-like helicase/DNA helicase Pif1-like protein